MKDEDVEITLSVGGGRLKLAGNKKEKQKKNLIVIASVCVLIILLGVILFFILNKKDERKRNIVINADNAEDVVAEMLEEDYVEPGYYTVSMNTDWHFSKGDAVSDNAKVDNFAENTNDVFFDVFLAENEEEAIYKSPVIPRGGYLEKIALDKPLEQGVYDCVMIYHLIDGEQETISTLRVAFTITVDS